MATAIFQPFSLRLGIKVMWSKIFDLDQDQSFKVIIVKMANLKVYHEI